MDRKDVISKLEKIHDEIKRHPFRITFKTEDIPYYKHLLYELSEVWCELIWRCEHSEEEKRLYRQFGRWIHNYRQELRTYKIDSFPMQYFDYYEKMLQVTHNFINTGDMSCYYDFDYFTTKDDKRIIREEKYKLITKETCGIDSLDLPRYWPVDRAMCVDEEKIKDYIFTRYPYENKSAEKRQEEFDYWKANVKPVLEWINKNYKHKDELIHDYWLSV